MTQHPSRRRGSAPDRPFVALPKPVLVSANIAEQIRERIVSGALPLGARLPSEADLAHDFEVSRPSVREALAALQFAGLVESRRGYGTVVVSRVPQVGGTTPHVHEPLVALSQAVDLLETRLVLEPAAMAAAATEPDRSALKHARGLIDGMLVAAEDPELHASSDIRVHRALLDVCRNVILRESALSLLDLALDPMLATSREHAWSSPHLPHTWAEHHRSVYTAIAAGDAEGARAGSELHLTSVVDSFGEVSATDEGLSARIHAMKARLKVHDTGSSRRLSAINSDKSGDIDDHDS